MLVQSYDIPRRVQGLTRMRAWQKLSKEAHAKVNMRRREVSTKYWSAIDDVWKMIDEASENIVVDNNKSLRRVQPELHMGRALSRTKCTKVSDWNTFCWKKSQSENNNHNIGGSGKDVLPMLVWDLSAEYAVLSQEERDAITEEYKQYKDTKILGRCISTKSRINNVTHTVKAVEQHISPPPSPCTTPHSVLNILQLNSLNSHTGVESILFITHGSTDLPLRPIGFATHGVKEFMPTVMGMDTQDSITKMEGFAVQGIKGRAAKNHQQRVSEVRGKIHKEIVSQLEIIMGQPKVKMHWKYYWQNVVKVYQVQIVGWPDNSPFANLSDVSSALPDLQSLLRKWKSGVIHWEKVSDEELKRLTVECHQRLENGEIEDPRHCTRSDKGKTRAKHSCGVNKSKAAAPTYKSSATINSDDEDHSPPSVPTTASLAPHASPSPPVSSSPPTDPASIPTIPDVPQSALQLSQTGVPSTYCPPHAGVLPLPSNNANSTMERLNSGLNNTFNASQSTGLTTDTANSASTEDVGDMAFDMSQFVDFDFDGALTSLDTIYGNNGL
ncbi:hypothetical protein BV22DRAFT_1024987 [Leucogyrophana mollusca]|uniref:Uncharacterized protein n=1 Tax=Leucogyrophana mollusca TaxID=85980 RepID=A0ACB8AY16_9AGAM|nr:hypothetical protein BV22DRAFT_1024987 [Leucogyrophana mollusca]